LPLELEAPLSGVAAHAPVVSDPKASARSMQIAEKIRDTFMTCLLMSARRTTLSGNPIGSARNAPLPCLT
jgi:hypothetical protein